MDLDAELTKLHEANDADTLPEEPPAPVAAAPVAPAEATPAAPARGPLSLDDSLPDIEDIPQSFRGKPFRTLLDDRRTAITQRDDIGKLKNDYESETRVLKSLLQTLLEQQAKPIAPTTATTPETAEDQARREQLDAILASDPAYVLGRTADIATEAARARVVGDMAPLAATVARLESEANATRIFNAHNQAGATLGRDPKDWKSAAEIDAMSKAVLILQLPQDRPESYVEASKWLDNLASLRAPKPAAAQPAAAVAPVAAPPPAPPTGTGAAAAVADPAANALSSRDADTLSRMRGLYEEATGRKMPKDVWDGTYQKVAANAPRRRSA